MQIVIFALVLFFVGMLILSWGHKDVNDYSGVTLTVIAGVMLCISIMWLGDLFGFHSGYDASALKYILIGGVVVLVLSLGSLKIEEILRS